MNAGCARKTVRSLENACHTWALYKSTFTFTFNNNAHWQTNVTLYKCWLVPRSTLKNYAPKLWNVTLRPSALGQHSTTSAHNFSVLIEADSQRLVQIVVSIARGKISYGNIAGVWDCLLHDYYRLYYFRIS